MLGKHIHVASSILSKHLSLEGFEQLADQYNYFFLLKIIVKPFVDEIFIIEQQNKTETRTTTNAGNFFFVSHSLLIVYQIETVDKNERVIISLNTSANYFCVLIQQRLIITLSTVNLRTVFARALVCLMAFSKASSDEYTVQCYCCSVKFLSACFS